MCGGRGAEGAPVQDSGSGVRPKAAWGPVPSLELRVLRSYLQSVIQAQGSGLLVHLSPVFSSRSMAQGIGSRVEGFRGGET